MVVARSPLDLYSLTCIINFPHNLLLMWVLVCIIYTFPGKIKWQFMGIVQAMKKLERRRLHHLADAAWIFLYFRSIDPDQVFYCFVDAITIISKSHTRTQKNYPYQHLSCVVNDRRTRRKSKPITQSRQYIPILIYYVIPTYTYF